MEHIERTNQADLVGLIQTAITISTEIIAANDALTAEHRWSLHAGNSHLHAIRERRDDAQCAGIMYATNAIIDMNSFTCENYASENRLLALVVDVVKATSKLPLYEKYQFTPTYQVSICIYVYDSLVRSSTELMENDNIYYLQPEVTQLSQAYKLAWIF